MSAANAETAVKKIQEDAAQKIAQLQSKVEAERAGKEYQIGLNQNFKRISRERANADRGIKPKKERSGYVVLSSRQKKYRYKKNRDAMVEVYLWETVIQTPYIVSFTAEQAMTETQELFARDENGEWLNRQAWYPRRIQWQVRRIACRSAVCDVEGLQHYRGEDIQCQRKGWILGDQHYAHETAG